MILSLPSHGDSVPRVFSVCTVDKPIAPIIGSDKKPGILRQIIDETARDTGIAFEYHYLPWLRCLQDVKHGNIDAVFNITRTPEREPHYAFPDTDATYLHEAAYGLYMERQGKFHNADTLEQLTRGEGINLDAYARKRELGLSAPLGFFSYDELKKKGVATSAYPIDTGMLLVARGRLDGYVSERFSAQASIEKQAIGAKLFEAFIMHREYEHIAFSKAALEQHRSTIEHFWKRLAAHRQRVADNHLPKSTSKGGL